MIVLLVILGALVWFAANTDTSISAVNPSSPAAASAGVTADSGQDLLALANDPAGLAQLEAHTVAATDVPVQSVVSDQGFWVGSTTNRIFVFTRQPIQIAAGQTVTFSGVVTVLPIDFQTRFGVDPLDGAAELQTQGHYVAVSDVTATSPTG